MQSSLVVSTETMPLGLSLIKIRLRETFHGANALNGHINPTRVSIA